VRIAALLLAWLLAACSASTAVPSTSSAVDPASPSTSSPTPAHTVAAADEPVPIGSVLPTELEGVELHTLTVGHDILERLPTHLGVAREKLEVAFASDHGARFVQMYAARLVGMPVVSLASGWAAIAYPPGVDDVEVSEEMIDGMAVTVVHSPGAAPRLGTFYLLPRGETLIVVQALEREIAEEALGSLP
jgi:hypothetical protein